MLYLLTFLTLVNTLVSSAYIPSPTPLPTPTNSRSAPSSTITSPAITSPPQPLQPRCDDGNCSFGGTEIQPSIATITVTSVTSVPCYITTFITNSQTITSTVYSTETQTSTQTKEGTVYIIEYQPTPIVKSSIKTTVLATTLTLETYWVETEGQATKSTVRTEWNTYGSGGSGSGGGTGGGGGGGGGWNTQPTSQPAWTHATANGAGSSFPTATGTKVNDGWAAAAAVSSNNGAVWGASTQHRSSSGRRAERASMGIMCLCTIFLSVVGGEILHFARWHYPSS